MNKLRIRLVVIILTFVTGILSAAGWIYYQSSAPVQVILPNSRWEPLTFKLINRTTELGGIKELRKTSLSGDDLEVRVWRGFGLGDLEGVILKRTNSQWTAFHVKADHYVEPQKIEVKQLTSPNSGWESFWKEVTEQGLLTLRDPSEKNCEDSGVDGTSYVVEVNQNKIYRTYGMRSGGKCDGVQQMEEIGKIIGLEFDSGLGECQTTEWFACMTFRKTSNQTDQ
jgi:hypothetical protein